MSNITFADKVAGGAGETGQLTDGNVNEIKTAVNSKQDVPADLVYTSSIAFARYFGLMEHTVSAPVAFTVDTVGALKGAGVVLRIVADGVNIPTYSTNYVKAGNSQDWDNTTGRVHRIVFFYDGTDYSYSITRLQISSGPDVSVPVLQSAIVANASPNKIVLGYNEPLNTAVVPATGDYSVSGGKTVTGISINGSSVTLTVNSNYVTGNVISLSYTAGTNKVQDAAGNFAANLTSQAVTNNVGGGDVTAPVLQTAAVVSGTANQIILTYNETLNSGTVPATTDFAVSGGKTVSTVGISGSVVTLTVSSNYTSSDTITVSYTAGTNKLQDLAGNFAANLTAQAVSNGLATLTLLDSLDFNSPIGNGWSLFGGGFGAGASGGVLAANGTAGVLYKQISGFTPGDQIRLVLDFTSFTSGTAYTSLGADSGAENQRAFTTPGIKTVDVDTTGATNNYFLLGQSGSFPGAGVWEINDLKIYKIN